MLFLKVLRPIMQGVTAWNAWNHASVFPIVVVVIFAHNFVTKELKELGVRGVREDTQTVSVFFSGSTPKRGGGVKPPESLKKIIIRTKNKRKK